MSDDQAVDKKGGFPGVIPIDRDHRTFLTILDKYEGSPSLDNFLDAFEKSMGKQNLMVDLVRSLKKYSLSRWRPKDLERFQKLVAKLDFSNTASLYVESVDASETGNEGTLSSDSADTESTTAQTSERTTEVTRNGMRSLEELQIAITEIGKLSHELEEFMQSLLDESSRYFVFVPALEIEQYLADSFNEDDDPARKIADYARAAFSRPSTTKFASDLVSIEADGITCLCLVELIQAISESTSVNHPERSDFERSELSEGVYSSLMYLMKVPGPSREQNQTNEPGVDGNDDESSSRDYWLTRALAYSFDLTQDLFDCVLEHQFRFSTHRASSPIIFHILCQFPFEAPYRTAEEFGRGVDKTNFGEIMVDGGWEPRAHRLPVIRWSQSHYLFHEFRLKDDDAGNAFHGLGYVRLMDKYSNYRKLNGGYSPLNIDDAADLCSSVRSHGKIVKDPLLAIAVLYHHSFGRIDRGLGCDWLFNDSGHASPKDLAFRATHYIAIAEQAFADGMDEFGAAILGFFLYSQSLFVEDGIYADMSRLSPLIGHGLKAPGQPMLEKCLSLAVGRLSSSKASLEAKLLSSYLRPRPALVPISHAPERVVPLPPEKAIIKNKLRSDLPAVFERFSGKAIELLIEAELTWVKNSDQFGGGELRDWGWLGVALAKPVEAELVARLKHVYESENYRQFHRDNTGGEASDKATLGAIVHMLKKHDILPDAIKESITRTGGVKLPIDQKLLRAMDNVVRSRNKGAHPDPFTEEDYLKLRKALFSEGGLTHLAEAFIPTREIFNQGN